MRPSGSPSRADWRTVRLAYGADGLEVRLPAAATVLRPTDPPAVTDVAATLRAALAHPCAGPRLRDLVRPGQRIAVAICDGTRAQPREVMLDALLDELGEVLPLDALLGSITVLVATGTHRANTEAELRAMLGARLAGSLRIVNHDCRDRTSLAWCGTVAGSVGPVPVWLHREWVEADLKVTTGFVEPHLFAGFSGGPKLVAPGLAGLETVLALHDAARIGHPEATWAVVEGNPVHDDIRAIAAATGVDFTFDVALDREQRIVAAFAGDVFETHAIAREQVRSTAMQPVDEPFDIVVTTSSGAPLDQNLYQTVKGISAAAAIVRPGGLIVCASECADGFPAHGSFRELLTGAAGPAELLARIESGRETVPDQWQAQILARVLSRARVALYCAGLDDEQVRSAHLLPTHDIEATVRAALDERGPGARVCVLPEGPQTVAYLASDGRRVDRSAVR